MMRKQVEILAPAGSFESMKAAVAAGADAVYMGGSRFGARAYAENPDEEKMLEAIDYVHLHGCRLYMTVNTLMKDGELEELYDYLAPYYRHGLDAVIVQDMGVFSYIKEHFPDLSVHASTQMTVTGPLGADLMMKMGASRIVTARELSLSEIRRIYDETGAEIESFVHGALCYSYSGQCLFSSLIGGRSGNRGRCAQTCRLPFDVKRERQMLNKKDERYVLSLKDLCTLDILPDILEAGVFSLKIEGRMKSPRYTAGVVSIYRKYVDRYLQRGRKGYHVDQEDRKALLDLFDRGGQTTGYYEKHNGRDMVVLKEKPAFREENRELYQYLDQTYVEAELKEKVQGFVSVREGEPISLTLSSVGRLDGELHAVTVTGSVVQAAQNAPATGERIAKQIKKTGNTPYVFESLDVEVSGNPFVPVQELNDLRRQAFAQLTEELLLTYRRSCGDAAVCRNPAAGETAAFCEDGTSRKTKAIYKPEGSEYALTVSLERPETLPAVLSCREVSHIYLDSAGFGAETWRKAAEHCHQAGKGCYLVLPHIYRAEAAQYFEEKKDLFLAAGFDGAVIRAWEEIALMNRWAPEFPLVVDFGSYTMNRRAEDFIRRMAPGRPLTFTVPVELNSRELEIRGCEGTELLVYGSIPMMVTAQCMKKTVEKCTGRPEVLFLRDRMGKEFPVKNHCRFCYNTIYNSSPLSLLKDKKRIDGLGPEALRLSFTTEDAETAVAMIRAFAGAFLEEKETRLSGEYTRGHFKRGVE